MNPRNYSLRAKLVGTTVATIVAVIVLIAIVLTFQKSQMLADRQDKIRNLVESVHSQFVHYNNEVVAGRMTLEQAQSVATETLRTMRYDDKEYFWINDFRPYVVMHPIKPELQGKDASGNKDKNGKALYIEFVNVVKAKGAGFVDYYWSKPGSDAPVPKLSYVKGFEPWGWIIGTGIYIDDVDAKFRESALRLALLGGLIVLAVAGALTLLSRNIINTLGGDPQLAAEVTRRIASGDLTADVPVRPGDNDSLLADIQRMAETLRRMIGQITGNAEQVSGAASQLLAASEEITARASRQSDAATSMAASMQQMAVSVGQVRENSSEAHNISCEAGDLADQGSTVIHNATAEMIKISEAVQSSSAIVEELGKQSDQITSIVNTIKEIADQTNLLALNAAIEAARAGEQGRGFAVVADEVRKLAERTGLSTTEIAGMVGKIQAGTHNAVDAMQKGVTQVSSGVELANAAGASINRIREGAQRVTEVVNDITSSITEQSTASEQIARQLEHIAQMSEESTLAVRQAESAARHLQTLSDSLHSAVGQFKV